VLKRRGYTTDELSELRHATRDDARVLAVAEFSPGLGGDSTGFRPSS
jgi:hypothetical protein